MSSERNRRILIVTLASLLFFARSWRLYTNPQFFLEDGTVFFRDSFNLGLRSIFESYAGYSVLYQRLVSVLLSGMPILDLPLLYLIFGSLVSLLVFWELSGNLLPARAGRHLMLLLALSPFEGTDLLTLTNSQWLLGFWLILFVSAEGLSRERMAVRALLFLLSALTGPFLLFLTPIIFFQCVIAKRKPSVFWLSLFAGCLLIQILPAFTLFLPRVPAVADMEFGAFFSAIGMLLFYPGFLINDHAGDLLSPFLLAVLSVLFFIFVGVLSRRERSRLSLYFLASALIFSAAALFAYRTDFTYLLFRPRYAILPTLAIQAALMVTAVFNRERRLLWLLLPFFFSGLLKFETPALEDFSWRERAACIGSSQACEIPLNWPGKRIRYEPGDPPQITDISK